MKNSNLVPKSTVVPFDGLAVGDLVDASHAADPNVRRAKITELDQEKQVVHLSVSYGGRTMPISVPYHCFESLRIFSEQVRLDIPAFSATQVAVAV